MWNLFCQSKLWQQTNGCLRLLERQLHVEETKNEYTKKYMEKERWMEFFMAKRLHGKCMRDVLKVVDARSWKQLRAGYFVKSREGYGFDAQEQAMRTRFFWATIERENVDPKCRVCEKEVELVGHQASGCSGLAQREYHRRHDCMGLRHTGSYVENMVLSLLTYGTGSFQIW